MEVLATDEMDSQIQYPFYVVPAALPASEEESLIDVPTSGSMKIELIQKSLLDFSIEDCAQRTLHRPIALSRLWCPLPPCTYVRVGSQL